MSDESRCGIFCIRHIENRRSLVCGSEIDAESEEMEAATASVHVMKNLDANSADPIGWPRRRHPSVSSTGIVWVSSVGLGLFENCAMVWEIEAPR